MDLEEIREHKDKAEREIAQAVATTLARLEEVTGLTVHGVSVSGTLHGSKLYLSSTRIDLGPI